MYLASMGLITIKIDKVIIQQEDNKKLDEIIELLKELTDEKTKQQIMDKLGKTIDDLKETV